jgi:hypothetical protein
MGFKYSGWRLSTFENEMNRLGTRHGPAILAGGFEAPLLRGRDGAPRQVGFKTRVLLRYRRRFGNTSV